MSHTTRLSGKWLSVFLGMALALGGCGGATPGTEAATEPPTEAVGTEELDFWVPLPDHHGHFQAQLDKLGIPVRLRTEFTNYDQELRVALEAGDPPEFAALYFEQVVSLQAAGLLMPLTDSFTVNPDDFLPDAIGTNTFDGTLYGLPWLRFGCTSDTLNLAALVGPSEDIVKVMEFLTAPEQQAANYNDLVGDGLEFYPTRQAVYDQVKPVQTCSFAAGDTPLTPELLTGLIDMTADAQIELAEVLEDKTLNPYAGAFVTGASFEVIALPFSRPIGATERADLDADSAILIGALLVSEGNSLGLTSGVYAIQCDLDSCEGWTAPGESIGDIPVQVESLAFEADPPFAWWVAPGGAQTLLVLIPPQHIGADPICIAFDSRRWCFG